MDLTRLARTPRWEWPPNGGNTLLAVLDDRQADAADRLLAAELAGEIVAIDDQLAAALLSLVGDPSASEPLRCRAALSLGPVLEQMDQGRDDYYLSLDEETLGPPPISEHTFHRIQETLRVRYLEDDLPTEVRRHVLEASVRAPADWHRDAIRAAYSSADRDWRLTAVFAMRYVRGFPDEIVAALDDPDEEIRYEAVTAAGNWEVDAAWPYVSALLAAPDTDKELLLAAIEAGAAIRPQEAEPLLAELSDSHDADIADAADNAMMMASAPFDDEFDDDSEL
jgi:HEAT repeat protein